MVSKKIIIDSFRGIRASATRFFAALAIIALGTAFFVGVRVTSPDMKLSVDKYFRETNFMDFTLLSSVGFTADDVSAVRAVPGVRGVMPAYSADAVTQANGEQKIIHVMSLPPDDTASADNINRPYVVSGRLPENDGECVIERNKINGVDYNIGDQIVLSSGTDADILDSLSADAFTVVGIIDSPLYMSKDRGVASIGSGSVSAFMMIPESAFKLPAYTEIYLKVSPAADVVEEKPAYSKAYDKSAQALKSEPETLAEERSAQRTQELQAAASLVGVTAPDVNWYVLGRDSNVGYADYGQAADRVAKIALVFPVIFVFVAALVCLANISRMVEEQRAQIGVEKALGYGRAAVALKYLLFALLAGAFGCAAGLAVGFTVFPYIIRKAYAMLYTMPYDVYSFNIPYAAISAAASLGVTILTAVGACYGELNSTAAELMRPRAPKPGRRIMLERVKPVWNRMKFTQKTAARNLFRYKSRSLMTIAGVALCTSLLLVGFGLNDAISGLGKAQFEDIQRYQFSVALKSGAGQADVSDLGNYIESLDGYESMQMSYSKLISVGDKSAYLSVPEDPAALPDFVSLTEKSSGKALALGDNGVLISEKLASLLNVKAGGEISLPLGTDGAARLVTVSGVFKNYLFHYIFMSPALYEKTTGAQPEYNEIDARLSPYDKAANAAMSAEILKYNAAAQVVFMSDRVSMAADITKSIYSVVLVLIVSAALLSFVVLFTLSNINVSERIREIATIKVLGFYKDETARYVLRENLLLTLIGSAAGLLIGAPLTRFIANTAEVENIRFLHAIHPLSFVLSAVLTVVFAEIVNLCMRPRLSRVNMVEALKTAE